MFQVSVRENMLKMLPCRGTAAGLWRLTSNISPSSKASWSDIWAAHKIREKKEVLYHIADTRFHLAGEQIIWIFSLQLCGHSFLCAHQG
jgi:hypothetical protein